jgi:hypothetical protein
MNLQTFEEYLQEKHMENYHGTDDDSPDAYEAWITDMQVDDLIQYGQEFGLLQFKRGMEGSVKEVKNHLLESFDNFIDNKIAGVDFSKDLENLKNL